MSDQLILKFPEHRAYKTEDFGMTWKNIIPNKDVYGFTRSIQEDYMNPNLLFLKKS